eukprot:SM000023S07559  [mRNA]  locus=s23:89481:92388:+ [translate_table: standard]
MIRDLAGLAPFVLRLGGSLQDHITYEVGLKEGEECPPITPNATDALGFSGGCLPMSRWDELNDLCYNHGCELVFGLNALRGRHQVGPRTWVGPWNPSNAQALIHYTAAKGYHIKAWELGNEVAGGSGIAARLRPEQYAADVEKLRDTVAAEYSMPVTVQLPPPLVVAADTFFSAEFYRQFLRAAGPGVVNAVSHHIYNLGSGLEPTLVERILNPRYLDKAGALLQLAQGTVSKYGNGATIWVGEAGGAFNSGQHGVTDAFVSAFWYLDQMAMAAIAGHSMYCRQSLVGGNYGLLNLTNFVPNPDYYGALLWRKLMGARVLRVVSPADTPMLRAYAHCLRGSRGGITLLLLNLSNSTSFYVKPDIVDIAWKRKRRLGALLGRREEYHLQPVGGDLSSQQVLLNGQLLAPSKDGQLPPLLPRRKRARAGLWMDALSYAYVTYPDGSVPACE